MVTFPLTVIVPTFNRRDALRQCLEHLEAQVRKDFQVVVVDDGSTDGTDAWIDGYRNDTQLNLRYVRQANSGPARARNVAISMVESPVVLLIGDDIFPEPEFTSVHMRLHEEHAEQTVVGLGLTVWSEAGQTVTPFMRWLDTEGMQFDYGNLLKGVPPDWRHFYTSNLSLKTALLRQFPFDETFRQAGMEDIELSCRIDHEVGLNIRFLPGARASHLHPTNFWDACRRMEKVGQASAHFHQLWPGKLPRPERSYKYKIASVVARLPLVMAALKALASASVRSVCPNKLMWFVFDVCFQQGYAKYHAERIDR